MKKNLSIYFGLLAVIIIAFGLVAWVSLSLKKEAVAPEAFSKILASHKYQYEDLSSKTHKTLKQFIKSTILVQDKEYAILYINCADEKIAMEMFMKYYDQFLREIPRNKYGFKVQTKVNKQSGDNFYLMTSLTKNRYSIIAQVADTILIIGSAPEKKAEMDALLDEMGYNFKYNDVIYAINILLIALFLLLWCASSAFIFKKAQKAPWAAFVPFYNDYVLCQMVDKNGWKMFLLLIPVVNIVYRVILSMKLARAFSKKEGFAVGLFFLNVFFNPIIAFDNSEYSKVE